MWLNCVYTLSEKLFPLFSSNAISREACFTKFVKTFIKYKLHKSLQKGVFFGFYGVLLSICKL
jgi:hypothetical protein